MDYVLQTANLSKKYKKHLAVNGVSMSICKGDIYGFVGENGSGKTTVIRLITGLIHPHSGSFTLFGVPNTSPGICQARRGIGAIVESPSIYMNMSARDNLKMQCTILGIKDEGRILAALTEVGLGELYNENKHVSNFSLGMRQRLGIAMALLGDPQLLILDEPMNGLDPAGIVEIRELILRLNQQRGITFLISSHILTELSLVATKYGIISKGKLIREITADQLHEECSKTTTIQTGDISALQSLLRQLLPEHSIQYTVDRAKIAGQIDLNHILGALINAGIHICSVNCSETSFEDYYLSVIGGARND